MSYEEEVPRRKKDPLKSFRDPKMEREEHYKRRLKIEEKNRRERWPGKKRKKDEE